MSNSTRVTRHGEETELDIDSELVAAPVTPLVLAVLLEGESYGYAILERIKEMSDSELSWTDGMVYPLFRRLRRLGYLTSEWRATSDGRCRRFYAITDDGRSALVDAHSAAVSGALGRIWPGIGGALTVGRHHRPPRPIWFRSPAVMAALPSVA